MPSHEQSILDLRHESERQAIRESGPALTFKRECEMWQERPKIISSREVLNAVWQPTVAQLINHDQTVHVTSGEDPELVDFYFHERKPPHDQAQVVSVSKDIYDSVAIAHDRRPLAEQTAFYAVLYSTVRALQPCRVVKFI